LHDWIQNRTAYDHAVVSPRFSDGGGKSRQGLPFFGLYAIEAATFHRGERAPVPTTLRLASPASGLLPEVSDG
jgi:hypothetical protein